MPHKCIPSVIRLNTWSVAVEPGTQADRDAGSESKESYLSEEINRSCEIVISYILDILRSLPYVRLGRTLAEDLGYSI